MKRRWSRKRKRRRKMMRNRWRDETENDHPDGMRQFFFVCQHLDRHPHHPHPAPSKSLDSHSGSPNCNLRLELQDQPREDPFSDVERLLQEP